MRTALLSAACVAATLSLAACGQKEPEVVNTTYDPQAEALKNAPPVELPPAIQASRTYRCKDNSLVYVDFMSNNTALIRKSKGAEPPLATLTSEQAGGEYKSTDGHTISGNSEQITYSSPRTGSQSCKA
jgi:predicted small lipoprotein YifL